VTTPDIDLFEALYRKTQAASSTTPAGCYQAPRSSSAGPGARREFAR
jgi:hypothetical protein